MTDVEKYNLALQNTGPFPRSLNIELTNHCNLRCEFCLNPKTAFRKKGLMREDFFRKLCAEVPEETAVTLCGIGEPTIHPGFVGFLDHLNAKFQTAALVTNAHGIGDEAIGAIVRSRIGKVTISLDYFDPGEYRRCKGGSLDSTLARIERLLDERERARRSDLVFQVNMLAQRGSELQIENALRYFESRLRGEDFLYSRHVKDLAGQVPVQHLCGNDPWGGLEAFRDSLAGRVDTRRYRVENWVAFLDLEAPLEKRMACRHPFLYCMVLWDGRVPACCVDGNGSMILGNVNEQRLQDVWQGAAYCTFRERMQRLDLAQYPLCARCGDWFKQK